MPGRKQAESSVAMYIRADPRADPLVTRM